MQPHDPDQHIRDALTEYGAAIVPELPRYPHLSRAGMPWSERDIAFVHTHYGQRGARRCAAALGRSPGAVRIMAWRLGVTCARRRAWTADERRLLRQMLQAMREHTGRSTMSIVQRLLRMAADGDV